MEPEILDSLDARLNPPHTALIIIDMQKDFCCDGFATDKAGRPLDAAKSIIPTLVRFRQAAKDAGVLVVHVGFETYPDHMSDSGPWLTQRRRSTYASDKIARVLSRIGYLERMLDDLMARDDTVFMTGGEIADWFVETETDSG